MNEKTTKDKGIKSKGYEVFQMFLAIMIAFISIIVVIFISYAGIPFVSVLARSTMGIILIIIFALELIILRYLLIRYIFGSETQHTKSR